MIVKKEMCTYLNVSFKIQTIKTVSSFSRFWFNSYLKLTKLALLYMYNDLFLSPFCCSWLCKFPAHSLKEQEAGLYWVSSLTVTGDCPRGSRYQAEKAYPPPPDSSTTNNNFSHKIFRYFMCRLIFTLRYTKYMH